MKPSRKFNFSSSTTTTVTYTFNNDHTAPPPPQHKTTEIPITVVHLPTSQHSTTAATAAVTIQSAYRSRKIRTLVKKISAVNSEANRLQRIIQRQETVDAIRTDEREKIKMNEALMRLLLKLDSVPGIDQTVRDLRRSVSRRIVELQEILDSVSDSRVEYEYDLHDGFLRNWDDALAEIEESVCRERGGGEEMERFCAEKLGFRCLQRFLRGP